MPLPAPVIRMVRGAVMACFPLAWVREYLA